MLYVTVTEFVKELNPDRVASLLVLGDFSLKMIVKVHHTCHVAQGRPDDDHPLVRLSSLQRDSPSETRPDAH